MVRHVDPGGARLAAKGKLRSAARGADWAPRWLGWLPDAWPVKVVDLNPLTDEQTDQLIVALKPGLARVIEPLWLGVATGCRSISNR